MFNHNPNNFPTNSDSVSNIWDEDSLSKYQAAKIKGFINLLKDLESKQLEFFLQVYILLKKINTGTSLTALFGSLYAINLGFSLGKVQNFFKNIKYRFFGKSQLDIVPSMLYENDLAEALDTEFPAQISHLQKALQLRISSQASAFTPVGKNSIFASSFKLATAPPATEIPPPVSSVAKTTQPVSSSSAKKEISPLYSLAEAAVPLVSFSEDFPTPVAEDISSTEAADAIVSFPPEPVADDISSFSLDIEIHGESLFDTRQEKSEIDLILDKMEKEQAASQGSEPMDLDEDNDGLFDENNRFNKFTF